MGFLPGPADRINSEGNGLIEDFVKDKQIKPHEVQEELLALPDTIFEALYGGAAYGGKSWIITMLPLFRGFYKYRGFKGIIFRRKFPDLEREIIRLSKEYYPKTGGRYNEQKHSWEWPEFGSYMDFGHVQHSGDIVHYDSAQYNYAAFDELTHFDAYPYHYMVGSRVRPGNASCNIAFVRNGTNPGGIGQTFTYERFVKPFEDGRRIIKDVNTGLTRIFIPAKAEDNPHGMEYDPLYVKKLEILGKVSPADYKAKRYGDWHAFKGSVFTTFRPMHFEGEPENALHVIEPFVIPEWWPRILTIDWGKTAMTHCLWGAISPEGRCYAYRERTYKGKDIAIWAAELKSIHDATGETFIQVTLCGSAWQQRGAETTAELFQYYSGLVPTSSENTPGSRVATLQGVHEFLRWEQVIHLKARGEVYLLDKAQEIYRMYGPEALARYRAQFLDEEDEINLPKLLIFNTCKILIETIPQAIYDEKKPEDIAEFDGDDPLDNLRYFCKTAKAYLTGEIGNRSTQEQIQKIIELQQQEPDMTRFYRQMEHVEQNHRPTSKVVAVSRRSRFSRRH